MSGKTGEGQSGGINISGSVGSVGGDMIGGNKLVGPSSVDIDRALKALSDAIALAPADKQASAQAMVVALKHEAAKGKDAAGDKAIAKLLEGFVALVPSAAGAVVSAFATPILGAIAGPATKYLIEKWRGE